MSQQRRSWWLLAAVSMVALVAGHVLSRRESSGGDMLDAVAAVQRRSPQFLISEPRPPANWVRTGALYLSRTPRTAEEMEALSRDPNRNDPAWTGVVCFKGLSDPHQVYTPWVSEGGDRCLDYGEFAVFGDPKMLQEIRTILTARGFQPLRNP